MMIKKRSALVATATAATLAFAACGGGGGDGEGEGEGGQPQRGGTLKFVGNGDVTSMDTAFSYYTLNYALMRGFTRQLVTSPTTSDPNEAGNIVADMATEVPTEDNGGISENGTLYTFTIKEGVQWNTDPPRQVTAEDMERGIERLCNPAAPSGALAYYTATIEGMAEYCDGLSEVEPEAEPIAEYIRNNDIPGVRVEDELTVAFKLTHPTPDFLQIIAEYFATPAPEEYLQYVPNSAEFNQNVLSNGPYMVTEYEPDSRIVLERNPAWNSDTDDVRAAYVDGITVQEGINQQSSFQQVVTGTADLHWDHPVPTSRLPSLYEDPRLERIETGTFNKYVVFNLTSPNADEAMSKLQVRQAVAYAVNKEAIAQIYGGPEITEIACQIMPDTSAAHIQDACPYPPENTPTGNVERARQLLAEAGYEDGLTLKMIFRNTGNHPEVAETLQQNLQRAGITLELEPVPGDAFYSEYLQVADVARRGVWDIAMPGWVPDWYGINARTYLQPLFGSAGVERGDSSWGTNYGFYNSEEFNSLLTQGLESANQQQAVESFRQAQQQVLQDVAIVPTFWQLQARYTSERVQNFKGYPSYFGDITAIWLRQ